MKIYLGIVALLPALSFACEKGWKSFEDACYKKFDDISIVVGDVEKRCQELGAHATSVLSNRERKFLHDLASTGKAQRTTMQMTIGLVREKRNGKWSWTDGSRFNGSRWWHEGEPIDGDNKYKCAYLSSDPIIDESVSNPGPRKTLYNGAEGYFFVANCLFPANNFVCKKQENGGSSQECVSSYAKWKDGKCVCDRGFIDIVDTNRPEAKKYKRGEKCLERVCGELKGSTSILFVIDSSSSITKAHWPHLVDFVKDGGAKLPNYFKIGFLKFSSKVTYKKWLEPGWTDREYERAVPTDYDDGDTHTPLALREARKMFERDNSKNKIVVLITDGLPASEDYDSRDKVLADTKRAANELRRDDIRLTAMGVGPLLDGNDDEIKKWLDDPKNDYLKFKDAYDQLKKVDFDNLMGICCHHRYHFH